MADSTTQDQGIAARLLNMERGELPLAVLSAIFFFFVLCGYFFLRPVREAMGVARGMEELRWLFVVTSVISLLAVLAFGGVVARMNRRRFIPVAFLFVIACLFVFSGLIIQDVRAGGGLIGTDAETSLARGVGYTFYVWLTVINLFTTSLFWAFMVDIFDVDQGKRMFAFIGIGGTLGALAGAEATSIISGMTESSYLPAGLMLFACGCYCIAIATVLWLDRMAVRSRASRLEALPKGRRDAASSDGSTRIGGTFWEGAKAVVVSPYLLGVGLWVVLMAIANTMIYFTQANIIQQATDTFSQRVGSFANFDFLAQFATLLTQIFITTRIIKKLGVGWTLAILPLVTVAGFAVLAVWPLYGGHADLPGGAPSDPLRHLAALAGNALQRRHALREVQGEDRGRRVSVPRGGCHGGRDRRHLRRPWHDAGAGGRVDRAAGGHLDRALDRAGKGAGQAGRRVDYRYSPKKTFPATLRNRLRVSSPASSARATGRRS